MAEVINILDARIRRRFSTNTGVTGDLLDRLVANFEAVVRERQDKSEKLEKTKRPDADLSDVKGSKHTRPNIS